MALAQAALRLGGLASSAAAAALGGGLCAGLGRTLREAASCGLQQQGGPARSASSHAENTNKFLREVRNGFGGRAARGDAAPA